MPAKLSVLITCKNERHNIRACIESVRPIADELVVADSGSSDGTLEIVRELGDCRVIEREYINSGNFKNWAIPQCRYPWVLIVDCDERITPRLAGEIRRVMQLDGPLDGYWIFRDNHWMGHPIRYSGWGSDRVLRLFRRDLGRYNEYTDHAELEVAGGRHGRLAARMPHYTMWTLNDYLPRMVGYTGQQAEIWRQHGRRPSFLKLLFTGPARFLHAYIIRLGFLDGAAGLQVSMITGFYSFLKQAQLWELYYGQLPPCEEPTAEQDRKAA